MLTDAIEKRFVLGQGYIVIPALIGEMLIDLGPSLAVIKSGSSVDLFFSVDNPPIVTV